MKQNKVREGPKLIFAFTFKENNIGDLGPSVKKTS